MLRYQFPLSSYILLILLIIISLPAGAATFTVTNLNDSGPGSLRQAILDANANLLATHTIAFQPGLTGTITLTGGEIAITGRMTINGPGESVLAVSGNNTSQVFSISSLGTTISGLTIKEGNNGISNSGYLTLSNLTLSANNYSYGGGISNTGSLTLSDITLSDNKAYNGGGIYNTGSLTATRLALSGNEAHGSSFTLGGGIYHSSNISTPVTISDSTFINNRSAGGGGGIYVRSGAITISNSTLSGNQSGNGGGIYVDGTLTVTNSTLFENSASVSGGGIHHGSGTLTVTNSTLSGNVVNGSGGGIYCFGTTTITNSTLSGNMALTQGGGINNAGSLTLSNSIVTGNTALAAGNLYTSGLQGGHNLFGENGIAGVEGATPLASEIIAGPVSSVIRPLADNGGPTKTHAPVPGGPAMDAGDNSLIPAGVTTDQRGAGFPRLVNATVDIGAVEGFTPPSTTGGASFSVMNNASKTIAYAVGLNTSGQLGAGSTVSSPSSSQTRPQAFGGRRVYPVRIRSARRTSQFLAAATAAPLAAVDTTDFIAIASAAAHTIALRGDGTVWAWGNNANGQLGDGTTTTADEPVQVMRNSSTPLTDVVAVAAGSDHSVAVKSDGTVWSWGNNAYGQLGDNSSNITTRFYPVQVVTSALTPLDKVRMVAASDVHTLALKADGTVWAWGDNARGALGTGDTAVQRAAAQVSVLNDVLAIMARGTELTARSLAQRADNSLWGWGDNSHCQLGDTAAALGNPILAPVRLANLSALGVSTGQIANGDAHGLARKSDGTVLAWGLNNQGQLGDGATTNRCAPVQVAGISGVVETVGAGVDHSFVTTTDGSVWGWGSNNEGQLGVGDDLTPHLTPTRMAGEDGEGYLNLKVEPTTYPLTVNTTGAGAGTVSGAGDYEEGATVTLTATPNAGSTFAGWSPSPCAASFAMPANALTCTATFTLATLPGDVNGDNNVNALDVVATINAVLGIQPLPAADVNDDGAINALDVVLVINRVLGL